MSAGKESLAFCQFDPDESGLCRTCGGLPFDGECANGGPLEYADPPTFYLAARDLRDAVNELAAAFWNATGGALIRRLFGGRK